MLFLNNGNLSLNKKSAYIPIVKLYLPNQIKIVAPDTKKGFFVQKANCPFMSHN